MQARVSGSDDQVAKATAVYDTSALNFYDLFVHGFCNRFAWKCPTETLIRQYDLGVTENHLEVGVGTGFLLDRCSFPSTSPRLGLIDVSKRSLEESSRRLARYAPHIYVHNILEPLPSGIEPYRSIGTNYVFHCVPGGFGEKGRAFGYLKRVLAKDGVLFGSTLLGSEVERNGIAKTLMGIYNRGGLFSNLADSPSSLYAALEQHFAKVELEIVGCCALFSARD